MEGGGFLFRISYAADRMRRLLPQSPFERRIVIDSEAPAAD